MARTKSKRKSDDDDAAVVKPRSKKRVQVGDTPPEAAPRKQRKSAAASLVKLKEIAAAEEELPDASEEDLIDVDEATADLPVGPDASTLESHDLQISEEANVAPGFRLWESSGIKSLAKSGETLAIAKINKTKSDYSRAVDIHYPEHFSLVPLVITQGPYQGRHVLMLEPKSGMNFFDFPPEIRNMVFSCLFEEDKPIEITTVKRNNELRRPLRADWNCATQRNEGVQWDGRSRRWIDKPPSALALLRVSKRFRDEAAPVVYGNRFEFGNFTNLKFFFGAIGGMGRFLRHICIGRNAYERRKSTRVFNLLKQAVHLRTISFEHANICQDEVSRWRSSRESTTTNFSYDVQGLLKHLQSHHIQSKDGFNILDLIKVEPRKCSQCKARETSSAPSAGECLHSEPSFYVHNRKCTVSCSDAETHCKEIEQKVHKLIATRLNIKDEEV